MGEKKRPKRKGVRETGRRCLGNARLDERGHRGYAEKKSSFEIVNLGKTI